MGTGRRSRHALVLHGGKQLSLCCDGCGATEGFQRVVILIQSPWPWLRRLSGWREPRSRWARACCAGAAAGAEGRQPRLPVSLHAPLLRAHPPSTASLGRNRVRAGDNSIESRRTKLILGAVRHGGLNSSPSKCGAWLWPRDPDESKPGWPGRSAEWPARPGARPGAQPVPGPRRSFLPPLPLLPAR